MWQLVNSVMMGEYESTGRGSISDLQSARLLLALQFPALFEAFIGKTAEELLPGISQFSGQLITQVPGLFTWVRHIESVYSNALFVNLHTKKEYGEIRKNARVIVGQVQRQRSKELKKPSDTQSLAIKSGIFRLPRELRVKIAAFTGEESFGEKGAVLLAESFCRRPGVLQAEL